MNIVMLQFPEETKKNIADILSKTAFKNSNIFDFPTIEEAKNNKIWDSTELILCFGNPLNFTDSYKIYNNIPLMLITEKNLEIGKHSSMLSNTPNYLPIKEITSFVLENCIYNTIEKVALKKELDEFKIMREELERKEEIFNNSSVGMYEIDSEGNFTLANDVYLNLLGLNEFEDLKDFNVFEKGFSTNGNRNKIKQIIHENGEILNFEDQILNANNQKLFVKENIKVKKNINGDTDGFYGIVENITERREAEKISRQNTSKFQFIVESAIDAIVICDSESKIIIWNKAAQKIFGYTSEEMINQSVKVLIPETYRAKDDIDSIHFLKSQEPNIMDRTVEVEGLRKDGSLVSLLISLSHWKEDTSIYFCGVLKDITERKAIKSELNKSRNEAEKADRLKSDFLTQISHEIRTPVSTLLNFTSLIKNDIGENLTEDLISSFNSIELAGTRLTRTIDLLIKIAEIQSDNYEPFFENQDISQVIEELFNVYKPFAEKKNLKIQFINSIGSTNILFDMVTITDVLSHIIDNAIKYTSKGFIKIRLKKSILNQITISVEDTGIGISGEYLKSMFNTFSQETSGHTRKFDGNGLGLSLVREYCNLNNVEVYVSSEKYSGSNFTLIFK